MTLFLFGPMTTTVEGHCSLVLFLFWKKKKPLDQINQRVQFLSSSPFPPHPPKPPYSTNKQLQRRIYFEVKRRRKKERRKKRWGGPELMITGHNNSDSIYNHEAACLTRHYRSFPQGGPDLILKSLPQGIQPYPKIVIFFVRKERRGMQKKKKKKKDSMVEKAGRIIAQMSSEILRSSSM